MACGYGVYEYNTAIQTERTKESKVFRIMLKNDYEYESVR